MRDILPNTLRGLLRVAINGIGTHSDATAALLFGYDSGSIYGLSMDSLRHTWKLLAISDLGEGKVSSANRRINGYLADEVPVSDRTITKDSNLSSVERLYEDLVLAGV